MEQPLKIFTIMVDSPYTSPWTRVFDVEDTDEVSAREFAEQCICAGKEVIIGVVPQVKMVDWEKYVQKIA